MRPVITIILFVTVGNALVKVWAAKLPGIDFRRQTIHQFMLSSGYSREHVVICFVKIDDV